MRFVSVRERVLLIYTLNRIGLRRIAGRKHVAYHVGTRNVKTQGHNRLYLWLSCVADGKYNNNIVRARTQELRTNYGLLVVA